MYNTHIKKIFGGAALFLDRSDINTDEIIPARYLTEHTKEALKPYLLEDLRLPAFDAQKDIAGKGAIVTRENFGCGSSREHAPWALEANGINIVVAASFARIFRGNMYNCGMIAAELPLPVIDELFAVFGPKPAQAAAGAEPVLLTCDLERGCLHFTRGAIEKAVPFTLEGFDRALVEAGGWVNYADAKY